MGPIPCHSKSKVVSACLSFRPVAPLYFKQNYHFGFFFFFFKQEGVCQYRYAYDVPPGDTDLTHPMLFAE